MLAVDTNVVVRLLVKDDPEQCRRAVQVFREQATWVPITVVLETEWVLRRFFRLPPSTVAGALRSLLGTPGVHVESEESMAQALDWFEQGMDFADALHLATARDCSGLLTFDRAFVKTAARIGAGSVAEP